MPGLGDGRAVSANHPVKQVFYAVSHGQFHGRCGVGRWSEDSMRAGTVTRARRTVAVLAMASAGLVMVAAARARSNASTANTKEEALAVNCPESRCTRAERLRSAWTCSMIACLQ